MTREKAWGGASLTTMNADHTSQEAVYTLSMRGVVSFLLSSLLALSGERRTSAAKAEDVRGLWLYCGCCQATKSKYAALQTSVCVALLTEGRRALARRRVTCTSTHVVQPANNELKTKTGVRLHLPLSIVFPEPLRYVSHITLTRRFPLDRINCQTLFEPCCFSLPKKWLQLNRCWFWGGERRLLSRRLLQGLTGWNTSSEIDEIAPVGDWLSCQCKYEH